MVLDVAAEQAVETVDPADVLELVEGDVRAVAAGRLEPEGQLEERMERRERVVHGLELELCADPEGAEREPDPGPLEECLDALAEIALELLRVRALEPDRDVGDGGDAVQVDEHRNESLVPLAVVQCPLEQARLAVLARGIEPDVVAADGAPEELPHVLVAIDDVLGRHGARVDERIDVVDHCARQTTS